jgi:hypothetical protein
MDTLTRNSRWTREPATGKTGKPRKAVVTERDIRVILPLLARYRYLPADFIHAFTGGDYQSLIKHLGLLSRKPNLYLNRPEQQREHAEALYRKGIFELDKRGIETLRELGFTVPDRKYHYNFAHELMTCQIAASIELGVNASQHQLIRWDAFKADVPKATLESKNPFAMEFKDGEFVTPDHEPFIIDYENGRTRFFPGFEADCGTEPIDASDMGRSSIRAKFRAYLNVLHDKIYKKHYGIKNCTIPFITNTEARMHSMMALLQKMEPGDLAEHIIFSHVPSFYAFRETFKAGGQMFTAPWKRAGLPDFHMNQGD